jgi:hypothetical protein
MVVCAGCAKSDSRLYGTWRSNRDESVADAFRRDPRWTNAPPEKVERFRDIFGHMTLTYSKGAVTSRYRGEEETLRYTVEDRGDDYVVIRMHGGIQDGESIRIRFVEGGRGYWITSKTIMDTELHEKFDRITEPGGAANRSQPVGPETNRTPPAAGSGG